MLVVTLAACGGLDPATTDSGTEAEAPPPEIVFPLPADLAEIDFVTAFQDAAELMISVNTQVPWEAHKASLDGRAVGCPDFWTGQFTDAGLTVGQDYGVSWHDDCEVDAGPSYDGWVWWDFDATEAGDPGSLEGRTSEASRILQGDALVNTADGVRFEFDGTASDSLYQVEAYGYQRLVYSSTVDATITGSDAFAVDAVTPGGYRTDLFQSITAGDVETYTARGSVYMFTPQLMERFDSIEVDLEIHGDLGAAPTDCLLEPLGWIGLRDPDAIWYDVVFLPRYEENITDQEYPNDPLSVCDGCGRLYVQGIEQEGMDVCIDLSFVFDAFAFPNSDDYVLPFHSL
ncbi:MAG: hypothetical protein ABMA64_11310 [Myxococcota bacterium]